MLFLKLQDRKIYNRNVYWGTLINIRPYLIKCLDDICKVDALISWDQLKSFTEDPAWKRAEDC